MFVQVRIKLEIKGMNQVRHSELKNIKSHEYFKKCGACRKIWLTENEFLNDKKVKVLWLQVIPGFPDVNCIIFEHLECGSTVSVLTPKLRHLLDRKLEIVKDLYGTEECNNLCNTRETMAACDKNCVNAPDRELARLLVSYKSDSDE